VTLVVDETKVTHWATQVSFVDNPDECRIACGGHPADPLDMINDPFPDRPYQSVPIPRHQSVRVGEQP
jgi:hypothetical protein